MSDSTHAQHDSSHHHVEKISTYFNVFAILMVLLVLTYVAAKIDLDHMVGGLNLIVAMTIAVIKALLVVLIFMHVKHGTRLVWAFTAAGFVWLVILFVMFSLDYTTRGYEPGVSTAVSAEATVRSAVIERNMSDDAINVSPPHN
jgi:cytochrome c oxidase subunit IV